MSCEPGKNDWVLYVDDEASNLIVFEAALGDALPVLTAASGAAALGLFERHEIAVLLTDQRMPGMTGVELLEEVRERWPDTTRVLITAYADLGAAVDAINRGRVDLYLKKPWDPEELLAALTQARLHHRLVRHTRDLERRLVETERTYALGVVAASIAHELRNPLSSLSLNFDYLQEMLMRGDVASAMALVSEGQKAVNDIASIVSSIELSTRSRQVGRSICETLWRLQRDRCAPRCGAVADAWSSRCRRPCPRFRARGPDWARSF